MNNKAILTAVLIAAIIFLTWFSYLSWQEKKDGQAIAKNPAEEFDLKQSKIIKEKIKQATFCQLDTDCTIIESKCPFGCYVSVNSQQEKDISKLINDFNSDCVYKCRPYVGVSCQDNQCQVSFVREEEG